MDIKTILIGRVEVGPFSVRACNCIIYDYSLKKE